MISFKKTTNGIDSTNAHLWADFKKKIIIKSISTTKKYCNPNLRAYATWQAAPQPSTHCIRWWEKKEGRRKKVNGIKKSKEKSSTKENSFEKKKPNSTLTQKFFFWLSFECTRHGFIFPWLLRWKTQVFSFQFFFNFFIWLLFSFFPKKMKTNLFWPNNHTHTYNTLNNLLSFSSIRQKHRGWIFYTNSWTLRWKPRGGRWACCPGTCGGPVHT